MARVTVEDCILRLPNRFELLLIASQRARDLAAGAPPTIARDRDKNPVVALREIADKTVRFEHLEEQLIRSQQKYRVRDEAEEDVPEFDALEGEAEAAAAAPAPQEAAPEEATAEVPPGEETAGEATNDEGQSLEELQAAEAAEESGAGAADDEA